MTEYHYPTAEEIEAIERRAAAMRAQVLADGVKSLKAYLTGLAHIFQRSAHS